MKKMTLRSLVKEKTENTEWLLWLENLEQEDNLGSQSHITAR